jgi:hypothetical protein
VYVKLAWLGPFLLSGVNVLFESRKNNAISFFFSSLSRLVGYERKLLATYFSSFVFYAAFWINNDDEPFKSQQKKKMLQLLFNASVNYDDAQQLFFSFR